MALFLHLTDLHLSSVPDNQILDDYKSDIIPPKERETRTSALRNTLRELGRLLEGMEKKLDAVFVTGDITVANQEDGFLNFGDLLEKTLKNVLPSKDRIAVIPGNHDVTWGTPPSSPERYKNFVQHIRSQGYVTPILDGIDIDVDGNQLADLSPQAAMMSDLDEGWAVFPINSSNYCGSLEPIPGITEEAWKKLPELLGIADPTVRKKLLDLRLYDVARISPGQLRALRDLIVALERRASAAKRPDLTRIALIHHQLLPVSANEEFKPYETITNLGLLRHFLSENKIDMVLHGHKHTGHIYWDQVYESPAERPSHQVLVISGSTIGGVDSTTNEICRLIDLRSNGRAPSVQVSFVPGARSGIPLPDLPDLKSDLIRLWASQEIADLESAKVTLISGSTVDEAYDRLADIFSDYGYQKMAFNVVCQLECPDGAEILPLRYPQDFLSGDAAKREAEFKDLVDWWQRPSSELKSNLNFTHGSRVEEHDQVTRVINTLANQTDKGRSIIALFWPSTDEIDKQRPKFPAFCLVQFLILEDKNGSPKLACIGYFRKQEIRYWWPVNIAELARLQRKVLERIKQARPGIECGPITTVSAVAFCAKEAPRVAVPLIDRLYDMNRDVLWGMIYSMVYKNDREKALEFWLRILDDLVPAADLTPDGSPVAIDGLEYVVTQLRRFSNVHGPKFKTLAGAFEALKLANASYAEAMTRAEGLTISRHTEWRTSIQYQVESIKDGITGLLSQAQP